jgi:hypothetical protein
MLLWGSVPQDFHIRIADTSCKDFHIRIADTSCKDFHIRIADTSCKFAGAHGNAG